MNKDFFLNESGSKLESYHSNKDCDSLGDNTDYAPSYI